MRCEKLCALVIVCVGIEQLSAEFYVGEYKTLPTSDADNEIEFQSRQLTVDKRAEARSIGWSTFRPLTPGGTIYLAFVFLVPLTLGKTARRRTAGWPAVGWAERLVERVRAEQQAVYDEMGYVDGNLMFKRALYDLRDSLVNRLTRRKSNTPKKRKKWKG